MSSPTYTDPSRVDLARAIGIGLTVAGGIGLLLLGGEFGARKASLAGIAVVALLATGIALLLWSRSRGAALWEANKAFLLSEQGAAVLHERREFASRTLWVGRVLLALFLVCGIVFFFLLSAIGCGDRIDGYCGHVGRPPEWIVVLTQVVSLVLGSAWATVVYWRRRHESETERIDIVVAEGQRRRRTEGPLAGTNRSSWE
ncbi:MAG: hypothetical protein NVV57_05430 [Demequina sp.]|nr:hypothetical protein [Demequina sp.]